MKDSTYKSYLMIVLPIIVAFNYMDRQALGLLLQNIKGDLRLTDTELGLLTGIAFSLFYSVMGIPIARWADRGNRVAIISVTTALWSIAVALCGVAGTFAQLLFIRIGVAIGEAGCGPPAHSLMADYFTRTERPRAVARYMLGVPMSVILGFFLAGWLNEFYGWRVTFMILGLPGLGLAALVQLTLREPRMARPTANEPRQHILKGTSKLDTFAQAVSAPTLRDVCVTLWNNTTYRHLLFCFAVTSFFNFGIAQWKAPFFIRSFGLKTGELGTWFAIIYGLGGLLGTYWGGRLATRHAAGNERLQLTAVAVVYCSCGIFSALIYLSPNQFVAFVWAALVAVGGGGATGPLFATIQTLVPQRMRAMAVAILYLFGNLIGMGLGPLVAGALSDALRPLFGEESLRYALLALCPGYLWGGWHLWRASKTVARDLETAQHDPHQALVEAIMLSAPKSRRPVAN